MIPIPIPIAIPQALAIRFCMFAASGAASRLKGRRIGFRGDLVSALCVLLGLLSLPAWSQQSSENDVAASIELSREQNREQLKVNWFYGAYVPKDVPLVTLSGLQREKLFVRQTFTTPGIYIKSAFLGLLDQAGGEPYQWGGGWEGYGRRVASNYARTAIQNVFSTAGSAALRYEPRYDRCHCAGFGPRTKHALLRNFVTYNETEREMRPQLALYAGALDAGMLSSVWEPRSKLWEEGSEGVLTQAAFGMLSNWVGEFAPEIRSQLERRNLLSPKSAP